MQVRLGLQQQMERAPVAPNQRSQDPLTRACRRCKGAGATQALSDLMTTIPCDYLQPFGIHAHIIEQTIPLHLIPLSEQVHPTMAPHYGFRSVALLHRIAGPEPTARPDLVQMWMNNDPSTRTLETLCKSRLG
jgi:hypothetical protein